MTDPIPPPPQVLTAFGALEPSVRLPGGQGQTYRSGDLIFKPAPDPPEIAWQASVHDQIPQIGFRIARPLPARDGAWIVHGWWAQQRLDGEPAPGRWAEIIAAARAFHAATRRLARPAFLAAKTDRWAIADRAAWQEAPLVSSPQSQAALSRLTALLRPIDLPNQLIHGDLAGNVLFADPAPPAVIDLAPYWRPAAFALAVIAVDALVWGGAPPAILTPLDPDPQIPQLLVRAALRRVMELGDQPEAAEVAVYAELITLLETLCA